MLRRGKGQVDHRPGSAGDDRNEWVQYAVSLQRPRPPASRARKIRFYPVEGYDDRPPGRNRSTASCRRRQDKRPRSGCAPCPAVKLRRRARSAPIVRGWCPAPRPPGCGRCPPSSRNSTQAASPGRSAKRARGAIRSSKSSKPARWALRPFIGGQEDRGEAVQGKDCLPYRQQAPAGQPPGGLHPLSMSVVDRRSIQRRRHSRRGWPWWGKSYRPWPRKGGSFDLSPVQERVFQRHDRQQRRAWRH